MIGSGEPAWLPEDIDLALAWQAEKKLRCTGCGHPLDESTDEANRRSYEAHEITCQSCAVIGWRQHALSDQAGDNPDALAGVRIYATRSK